MKVSLKGSEMDPTRIYVTVDELDYYFTCISTIPGAFAERNYKRVSFPPDFTLIPLIKGMVPNCQFDPEVERWFNRRRLEVKACNRFKLLPDFSGHPKLYPFQRVDVAFMKSRKRVLNSNGLGTGKTIEALATVKSLGASKTLVVCPKTLFSNWDGAIKQWLKTEPLVLTGTVTQRMIALNLFAGGIVVTNYEMLRKNTLGEQLTGKYWDVVIFDEAHHLKSRKAQQTKGALHIGADAIYLLTATPVLNAPSELWSLLHLLYPQRFTSYWGFVDRFCELEVTPWSVKVVGNKNTKVLHYILSEFTLRREKSEVLDQLPELTEQTIEIDLEPEQRRIYKELEENLMVELESGKVLLTPNTMALVTRLRQICLNPKLVGGPDISPKQEAILEIVSSTDEKVVVFTWFKDFAAQCKENLMANGFKTVIITGDQTVQERGDAVRQFWEDADTRVIVGTIAAMSEGLNLQNASTVIFADRSWVPFHNEQAIGRLHRMGQKNAVNVIYLETPRSIETRIRKVLERKEAVINEAMAIEEVLKMYKNNSREG